MFGDHFYGTDILQENHKTKEDMLEEAISDIKEFIGESTEILFYGDKWYLKFFNTLHINYTISVIKDSVSQQKEINDKYGTEWFKKHIDSFKLIEKKLIYSYEALIKDETTRKLSKKKRRK